jgi:hypothetical protein
MKILTEQRTIQQTVASGLCDPAKNVAKENIAKIKIDRPEIYAKAVNLHRVLGISGEGADIALSTICLDLIDVQRWAEKKGKADASPVQRQSDDDSKKVRDLKGILNTLLGAAHHLEVAIKREDYDYGRGACWRVDDCYEMLKMFYGNDFVAGGRAGDLRGGK